MLKKETIIAMATALKMDVAAVGTAFDNTELVEVPFDVATLKVFTDAELTSRESTLKTNHEKAGMDIALKNFKTENGIEVEGKDPKKIGEAFKAKVLKDANVQESDKIKERDTVIEGLRANLVTATTEKESFVKQTKEAQLDSDILSWTIDKKPDHLTNKEWLTLIKSNNIVEDHEGQLVVKRDGKIVANPVDLKSVPAKDALVSYIDERKWGKTAAAPVPGRAGGDSKTGEYLGIANMKQFKEHLTANNISANGAQAQQMLQEINAANTNFDFATT